MPSTFQSSLGFLFDSEVFQLKISEETNTHAGESVVVFNYGIQQVSVLYTNQRENFFQFLINLCAIIGGVFTITKMFDGAVHKTSKILFKQDINKLS